MTPFGMENQETNMKLLAITLTMLLFSGCANYQFGDISRKLITMKQNYCAEQNIEARALTLLAIHAIDPQWIPVCMILEPTTLDN